MTAPADARARDRLLRDIQLARDGVGPLLQRDYWAVIEGCGASPSQLVAQVSARFCEIAPPEHVRFSPRSARPLGVGDELDVLIRPLKRCRVRLVCRDAHSFTLATLVGHPEAGRITFGAYRHASGRVVFHIRSRCRTGNAAFALGYAAAGEAMQTNTWTDFVAAVACTFGRGVLGDIHAETRRVEPDAGDAAVCVPTFVAVGED